MLVLGGEAWVCWDGSRPSNPGKAGLQGEGLPKTQRRLTPEERCRLLEALRIGVERGYGYVKIWRMLRERGVDVSRRAVEYWYRKCFPEKVRRGGEYLPRELRIKLYEKVLELRKAGLGYKRVSKKIKELYGVALSPAVIVGWCRGVHTPYNGIRIPTIDFLKPSPKLAYIIGVVAGDGWAVKNRRESGGYKVGVKVRDMDFVEEFARCLGRVLRREPPKPISVKGGLLEVRVQSKALYQLLQKPIDFERIGRFVEHCEDCKRGFLRGFFDSEGSVNKRDGGIYCVNTDVRLLEYVQKLLRALGIETSGPRINMRKGAAHKRWGRIIMARKDVYCVEVRAKDRLEFYRRVGFTIKRKQQNLEEYLRRRGLLEDKSPNQPSPTYLSTPPHTDDAIGAGGN